MVAKATARDVDVDPGKPLTTTWRSRSGTRADLIWGLRCSKSATNSVAAAT